MASFVRRIANAVSRIPVAGRITNAVYARRFNAAVGQVRLFRGIYPTFEAATRDIPAARLQGYDNEPSARRLAHERLGVNTYDYPVMLWLERILLHSSLLFDLGGHVGISYYGFKRYLQLPPNFRWLVYDVPAVVELGRQIAAQEDPAGMLRFTTSIEELASASILLAAGSLQFVEDPMQLLRSANSLPPHILLNKMPMHEGPSAVTLHNFGSAFCPYHLFNRASFLAEFDALGYSVVDEWETRGLGCDIPLHPEHCIGAYSGFYLRRRDHS